MLIIRIKKILPLIFLWVLISCSYLFSQPGLKSFHPLSGKFAISLEGGLSFSRTDFRISKFDSLAKLSFEYYFPTYNPGAFGIHLFGGVGDLSGEGGASLQYLFVKNFNSVIRFAGAGLSYNYQLSRIFIPFISLGASYIKFSPRDYSGNELPGLATGRYKTHSALYTGEIGIKYLFDPALSLNLSFGLNYSGSDNLDDMPDEFTSDRGNDYFYSSMLGISLLLNGVSDIDDDGISDEIDLCDNTPAGINVDEFGCPIDSDKDGVADYVDKCPGTSIGTYVDPVGCPIDSDKDGVADDNDLCENTPQGVKVNTNGCPLDSDYDGVADYLDKCPGTGKNILVDNYGCPVEKEEEKISSRSEIFIFDILNFETGSANLTESAIKHLDKIIRIMKDYPGTRWLIEGHTDNSGGYNFNKELSYERTASVVDYLLQSGIESGRLVVAGMGEEFPLYTNQTSTGKSINRRVTIELLDESITPEELKKEITEVINEIQGGEIEVQPLIFFDGADYTFQISSWKSKYKALSEVRKYIQNGFNAFISEAEVPLKGGKWFRVRIGYFDSAGEAAEYRARFFSQSN